MSSCAARSEACRTSYLGFTNAWKTLRDFLSLLPNACSQSLLGHLCVTASHATEVIRATAVSVSQSQSSTVLLVLGHGIIRCKRAGGRLILLSQPMLSCPVLFTRHSQVQYLTNLFLLYLASTLLSYRSWLSPALWQLDS